MAAVLSSKSGPDTDRAASWKNAVTDEFTTLAVTSRHASRFAPGISMRDMGQLKLATIESEACRVHRSPVQAASAFSMPVRVNVQMSGVGVMTREGRQALVGEGELIICDSTRPYSMEYSERFGSHLFSLPRGVLGVTDTELRRVVGTAIRPSGGAAAMLASTLTAVAASAPSLTDTVAEHLAGNVTDLLATLVGELAEGASAVEYEGCHHLVPVIRQYISHHLSDPELTPETIAAAHHISVRYLHRIFEEEGMTVSRLVQQRRLAECRRELARRAPVSPTVSAVAHRWGFVNAAHFSKVFRAAFGMSPSEWRDARVTAPK